MVREELYQAIFKRKSVRKFESSPLDDATLADINRFVQKIEPLNPLVNAQFGLFGPDDFRGAFRADAPHNMAIFSAAGENFLPNAGFMMQQLDLYLSSKGIGSCYQGLAKLARDYQAPMNMQMVMGLAFGRPVGPLHRTDRSEFKRVARDKIAIVNGMDDVIEAVRLAPSANNSQSWFFVGDGSTIHGYSAHSMISGRLNKFDLGIALCHMYLAVAHTGKEASFQVTQRGKDMEPKGYEYAITMTMI